MTHEELMTLGNAIAEGLYEGLVNNSTEVNKENDDLIRRQDVLALAKDVTLQNGCKHRCIDATQIYELPSAERKTGKWIFAQTDRICSECNTRIDDEIRFFCGLDYCPKCGADMRGEQDD